MFSALVGGVLAASLVGQPIAIKVVSYNIRHGAGMDDVVDITRSAKFLSDLNPDLVGLQEVDEKVKRSGSVDQAAELGKLTGLNHAFGAFMDYDGGRYGMGLLSRFKVLKRESIRLPEGNEPRVALLIESELPSGETLTVVNVHFDWVGDDEFRFAQASFLAERLKKLTGPWVLLGDFNDEPGSRTIEMFRGMAKEAVKPAGDRFTFSSVKPEKEIDFVFVWPADRWDVKSVKVLDEKVISDHRPVLMDLTLNSG